MKTYFNYVLGMIVLCSFSNCANGKKLQTEPPVSLRQSYYTTWVGGVEGSGSGLNLFIPIVSNENAEIEMDSVYFRGKRAKLQTKPGNPNLYIAYFTSSKASEKVPDLVMSSDPKEEYGNKPPVIIKDFPFHLKEDEAMVSYKKGGENKYFKITGIREKDDNNVKIKNPENI